MDEERKRQYFAELAANYDVLAGYTTRDIFAKFLDAYAGRLDLLPSSVVHDNASGPGTATQVLVQRLGGGGGDARGKDTMPTIVATDYAPGMIHVLRTLQTEQVTTNPAWNKVTSHVLNSEDLTSEIPDGYFTHSISNFSLFTIQNAVQSLRETYRTLMPGGIAVVLLWKRFAVQNLLAAAQDHVKGDGYAAAHAVPVNGPQYFRKEVVPNQLVEAGFDAGSIETWQMDHLMTGQVDDEDVPTGPQVSTVSNREKWDGLFRFMTSTSISGGSTKGWSEEEASRWSEAVEWAMDEERKRGGLKFEAWVTVVKK